MTEIDTNQQHIDMVTISIANSDGKDNTVVTWDKQSKQWRISGPVYPKYIKLMASIFDWIRDTEMR